ncbi:ABC transporter ATP-binding protein [Caballeronia sp.]|uniref:ABC transporter ATP-binding protein n=1 Tax=Caballeronia sp. TaxID=1931223 RepID=UPI003C620ED8
MSQPRAMPTTTDTPLLRATGLTRYDAGRHKVLLHATTFALSGGQRTVITGPSGSGKSVFLRVLALLDPFDDGAIQWRGRPVTPAEIPAYRRRVAYIAQRPAMLDGSVEDNLRYPFSLKAYRDVRFDRGRAVQLANHAGRGADFLDKSASDLSGGEAQVAALIRVLQVEPDVLLLDEPTASLDPDSALQIEALVNAWFDKGRAERASIWVSHDPAQAKRVGERQMVMTAGVLT